MKTSYFHLIIAFIFSMSCLTVTAQIKFERKEGKGSPIQFMKEHPEYIYINKPDPQEVAAFDYLISTSVNTSSLGLNGKGCYIIIESFDGDMTPKALLFDGSFKKRIVKHINTSAKRLVYFLNSFLISDLLSYDNMGKSQYKLRYGLSSNGVSYARNNYSVHTVNSSSVRYISPMVKVDWTENPEQWLESTIKNNNANHAYLFQQPATLKRTKGWIFDILFKVDGYRKYGLKHKINLTLWKDKDHKEPLPFLKMPENQLSFHPDFNTNDAVFTNEVILNNSYDPLMHQYYFLDQSILDRIGKGEVLANGKIRLKAYYSVCVEIIEDYSIPKPIFICMPDDGECQIDLNLSDLKTSQPPSIDRTCNTINWEPLCPPHNYQTVNIKDNNENEYLTNKMIKKELPLQRTIVLGEDSILLLRRTSKEGSCYYLTQAPVTNSLWDYVMKGERNDFKLVKSQVSLLQTMDFLINLNKLADEQNLPFSFELPSYKDAINYLRLDNDDYLKDYESLIDSISICTSDNTVLSQEQVESMKDKSGVCLKAGCIKNDEFQFISIDDSTRNTMFFLKAFYNDNSTRTIESSFVKSHMFVSIVKECTRCHKRKYDYQRSQSIDIKNQLISPLKGNLEMDYIGFVHELVNLNNYDNCCKRIVEVGFEFVKKGKKFSWGKQIKDNSVISIFRSLRNDPTLYKIEISLNQLSDEEICGQLIQHGYQQTRIEQTDFAGSPEQYRYYNHKDGQHFVRYLLLQSSSGNTVKILEFKNDDF